MLLHRQAAEMDIQMNLRSSLIAIIGALPLAAFAGSNLTDEAIRALIVQESVGSYAGNCPCPYNVDRAGRSCGRRSAWSKPGGSTPICYTHEVSDEQIKQYRARREI